MNSYKEKFIRKFGIEMWEYDERTWKERGYTIDKDTGYLIRTINSK